MVFERRREYTQVRRRALAVYDDRQLRRVHIARIIILRAHRRSATTQKNFISGAVTRFVAGENFIRVQKKRKKKWNASKNRARLLKKSWDCARLQPLRRLAA